MGKWRTYKQQRIEPKLFQYASWASDRVKEAQPEAEAIKVIRVKLVPCK
jgi:hypothetical protein